MSHPEWIVCGFYTPDYWPWAEQLTVSLDAVGAAHDIVPAAKLEGGWEANTMAKAGQVLDAMDRHPDKVIIFIDVDCQVRGDLAPLAKGTRGDVALRMPLKQRLRGVRLKVLSGTIVIRPTVGARALIEAWADASREAGWGAIDQTTLAVAIAETPGATIELLEPRWCALPDHHGPDSVIVHDRASHRATKISNTRTRLDQLWRRIGVALGREAA